MDFNKNTFTEKLQIKYPIVQGPFGGGLSTIDLVVAVSEAGGLGSFGAHHLSPDQIRKLVSDLKARTQRPFAVNLWVSSEDSGVKSLDQAEYERVADQYRPFFQALKLNPPAWSTKYGESFDEQIEALIEAEPKVISFVFGIPSADIIERCRKKGIATMAAATTLDEAIAVERAGLDFVVVSGFEAGGHRPVFLRQAEKSLMGLHALLAQVAGRIKIPVIAAGGLVTAESLVAARVLGASAFQIGTAFLACRESGASSAHKEALFSEKAKFTMLSRHYTGRLARFIENEFLVKANEADAAFLPYPAQNYLLAELKSEAAKQGKGELAAFYAGQGAPLLKYKTAAEVMKALVEEIPKVLAFPT